MMSYADPKTGKDEPPFKDWRNRISSMGPDFGKFPSAWWGWRDHELAAARYQPLGEHLPVPPAQTLPGFSIFPDKQRAPETAGDRALREIKNGKLGQGRR